MQRRDSGSGWGKSQSRGTLGGRRAAMRVIRAGTRMVVVYEQDPIASDAGPRTLVFESSGSVISLTRYPADWRTMTDEAVLALRKAQA